MTRTLRWRAMVVGLAVVTALAPAQAAVTRLGAEETVGYATVSAADTIRSVGMLAEVAAGVSKAD